MNEDTAPRPLRPALKRGEQGRELPGDLLGYSDVGIDALAEAGITGDQDG